MSVPPNAQRTTKLVFILKNLKLSANVFSLFDNMIYFETIHILMNGY